MLLGSDAFVEQMGESLLHRKLDTDIVRYQRFPNQRALEDLFEGVGADRELRNRRIHEAVFQDGYTLSAIGKHIGLHPASLSRIVKQVENELRDTRYKV